MIGALRVILSFIAEHNSDKSSIADESSKVFQKIIMLLRTVTGLVI